MTVSKRINMNNITALHFFTKIVAFIILSWACPCNNDEYALSKILKNGNKVNISLYMRTHRLLANHVYKSELKNPSLKYEIQDGENNDKSVYNNEDEPLYENLKQVRSNSLEDYKRRYSYRYAKKKGLSKLDCYLENRVFNTIDKIYSLAKITNNNKKRFKRKLYEKYGLPIILYSLYPLFGLIVPIIFYYDKHWYVKCNANDRYDSDTSKHTECTFMSNEFLILHNIYFCSLFFIYVSVIIYIFIKVKKYHKLKKGGTNV
ncbi:Plasmodium exported protein, unknown function [Plasmodium vivax]|uniref:Variable surface protein n=1 Tax=Plasmodium vivax TaxID=5855 RepID=A0A565A6S0_PLAVI|nr:Plasmodium exported protein, unknown function [Plasmodium vivax]